MSTRFGTCVGHLAKSYFIHVFSLETHSYLDLRIQIRLWPEMFRVTDGRIYNGYMKSDTPFALNVMDRTFGLKATNSK